MKILHLNVSKEPFEVMISGEKNKEYRKPSKWIKSRLFHKKTREKKVYSHIKVVWGYGSGRPFFIAKFKYFITSERNYTLSFSNGLKVEVEKGDYIIHYGKIVATNISLLNTLWE